MCGDFNGLLSCGTLSALGCDCTGCCVEGASPPPSAPPGPECPKIPPPQELDARPADARGAISLSWTMPCAGGHSLSAGGEAYSYRATMMHTSAAGDPVTQSVELSPRAHCCGGCADTLVELTPGIQYSVWVQAVLRTPATAEACTSRPTPPTLTECGGAAAPAAVVGYTNVGCTPSELSLVDGSVTCSSFNISWHGGCATPPERYAVRVAADGSGAAPALVDVWLKETTCAPRCAFALDGLKGNTSFTVEMFAADALGRLGKPSRPLSVKTKCCDGDDERGKGEGRS